MSPRDRPHTEQDGRQSSRPRISRLFESATAGRRDKRSRPKRWADAAETLADVLDDYQAWRDSLPSNLADSAIADRLDELLHLRDAVDQLAAAELPRGFGRD